MRARTPFLATHVHGMSRSVRELKGTEGDISLGRGAAMRVLKDSTVRAAAEIRPHTGAQNGHGPTVKF